LRNSVNRSTRAWEAQYQLRAQRNAKQVAVHRRFHISESNHLENRDYYAEGERVVGQWQGRGAERLGLGGEVKSEDFEALRQGLDPETGEFLRQRKSADRIASDGTTQSHGRTLYDFTMSASKFISIMAVLGEDRRLIDAHERAVSEALQELEAHRPAECRLFFPMPERGRRVIQAHPFLTTGAFSNSDNPGSIF
jgi:conjugative relaxase-like TrwC/TraI family protein